MTAVKKFGGFMGRSFLHVLDEIKLKGKIGKEEMGLAGEAELSLGMVKKVIEEYRQTAHPERPFLNDFENTLKNWLEDTLKEKNERMVIFIDDLDRCMPDIALQVLEALKLYLKIDKLIFVIGVDKPVFEEAVRAYYAEKNIKNIDPAEYLNKMFQVELHLSPSKGEIETYLDDLLAHVEYEEKLEYKDGNGKKRFYELFKRLISKYGGRNPREIKRLINSSLIRGAGAGRI